MNRATVVVAALVALALAVAWWSWPSEPAAPRTLPANAPAGARSPTSEAPTNAPPAQAPLRSAADDARTAVTAPDRTASPAPTAEQGLRGTVVDTLQHPLGGLAVFLVDSAGNESPMALSMLRQQGAFSPIASAETAADGSFAVGVPVPQDRLYELYVVSREHATARIGGLRLLPGKWHELAPITMTAGAVLRGRVTVLNRDDLPVWPATVSVEVGAAFADLALRSLPAAGHGLVTTTDANGAYELRNVPSRGIVQVSAVAPNFARQVRTNVELTLDRPVEVNFGLSPGVAIRGDVVDGRGRAIAGARVEAWPKGAGGPFPGVTDDAGRFEVLGLAPGTYRLRVQATGYERHDEADVAGERNDVRCVLYEQSRLRVQVVTPAGDTLRSYQLALRRVFPERNDQIAAVFEVPEQRVRLDGLTDTVELSGVPIGTFVCQVEAEGFAKTLSDPIDNQRAASDGPRELSTVVRMRLGASLRGRVQTEDGQPLAGATVVTQTAGTQPDSPLTRLLAGAVPDRITVTRALTDADGAFAMSRLALADYQLQIEHPDACRHLVPTIRLDRDGEHELPVIVVRRGALVGGRVTVAGRVVGQIKVVLSTVANVAAPQDSIRLETITDPDGRYRFAQRVPPGNYELRAAVVGTSEPEAQIFRQLLQLQRSSTTLSVAPGQAQVERDIDLPSDH